MKKFLERDLSQKNQEELADCYGGQTKQFFRKFNKNQAYLFKAVNRLNDKSMNVYISFLDDLNDFKVVRDRDFYLLNLKLIRAVKNHKSKDISVIFTIIEEQLYYCEKCRIQCPFNVFLHSKDFVDYEYLCSQSFYLTEPKYVNSFARFLKDDENHLLCFDDLKVEDFVNVLFWKSLLK